MAGAEVREQARCDHCGQTDDHPKVHAFTGETYHHDCLPYDLREAMVASSPTAAKVIEKAESGTHGAALVKFIASQK